MGAAGRDFHNFNVFFRNNKHYQVVAFTAAQIPGIEDKVYPSELCGKLYPAGIPIYKEERLSEIVKKNKINEVVFSYSDVSYKDVMQKASEVLSCGADFKFLGRDRTMLKSSVPVISVCATRTGCGKSQTTRKIIDIIRKKGKNAVVVRHPMPYGDLIKQSCQRFSSFKDLDFHNCTIEEREEYEPHLESGVVVFAGVDYKKILKKAEAEADMIIWDGGNNDMPFYYSDLEIVVVDPLRVGHELAYYPGEANLRCADVIVINKENSASIKSIKILENNIKTVNKKAVIIHAESEIKVDRVDLIRNKKVLVIEDGPTLTHGDMDFGAGFVAAKQYKASQIISPIPYSVGSIKKIFAKYKHLKKILPAMGYGKLQVKELEKTINNTPCDTVILGTPIDLRRIMKFNKKTVRVSYELKEISKPDLEEIVVKKFLN